MTIIAVDIGGTEIKGARYVQGTKEHVVKQKTDQSSGKESTLNTLFFVIDSLIDTHVDAISIVTAGSVDPIRGTIVHNMGTMDGWIGFSLKDEVSNKYNCTVYVENDANGAMIAEMESYYKQGVKHAVMLTLGTGVGTAVVINQELHRGANYQVEFGHMTLVPDGIQCTCGNNGCAEAYLSGSALTRQAQKHVSKQISHGKELFDLYTDNSKQAIKIIDDYTHYLAIYINSLRRAFDPELFIIGGGVSNSSDILFPILQKKLSKLHCNTLMKPAKYLNEAGIKGAYLIAKNGGLV